VPNIEIQPPQSVFSFGEEVTMIEKLLTLQEVLELTTVSYPTIYRWLNAGTFPQPVNGRGRKLLWTQSAIISWMNQQSTPVSNPIVTTSKERRQAEKAYQARQENARAVLERHRKAK